MELNKRKSLLTPASPTAWGMIHGDISNQQDIIEKIGEIVKTELENSDITDDVDLTGYATENWVKEQGYLTEHQSLADYYTKDEVDTAIENVEVDLTGYATESWVTQQGYIKEHQSLDDYYTKSEVDTAIDNIEFDVDLTGYATIEYVNEQIGEINTITEDILG